MTRAVLTLLATYRLTRLVALDSIWEDTRGRLIGWAGDGSWRRAKIGELVGCPWCVSVHAGALVVVAAYHVPGVWFDGPALVLAASAAAGLLASWEGE